MSDAEREAAANELREHFATGRLDSDELEQRLTAVFAARTRGDLKALFTDLPSGRPAGTGPVTPADAGRPFGAGPFGARGADWGGWTPPGGNAGGPGRGWGVSAGRMMARAAATTLMMAAVLVVGILGVVGVFGLGGRPIGIVLLVAAFSLLRRLFFIITGRGRRGGCGRRGGRRRF